jgi:hypothetical protein
LMWDVSDMNLIGWTDGVWMLDHMG